MAKTTRHERRKRAIASGAAEARGVSKIMVKKRSMPGQHASSKAAPGRLVGKDGKQLVKRPAARGQHKGDTAKSSTGKGEGGRKKKRPRSQVDEEEAEDDEDDAQPLVVDELVSTIQEHDQFFSRMLDMIPEHLVLPAKEVTESSYASKYMKNKKGEAPQQSKKEESKKNKRARYAADNQKTLLERQQERAKAEGGGQCDDDSDGDGDGNADGDDEGLEAAAAQDGLQSEVLKGKNMDVASMDALKKRIEERIKNFQEKRTAAEGSRRAKTAAKRSAQNATKRENKRKGIKAKKKGREGAIAAAAAAKGGAANGSAEGAKGKGARTDKDEDVSIKTKSKTPKPNNKAKANGSDTYLANPELPPLPTVEDVGDIEFSGLRGVVGDGSSRGKHGLPKMGAPGSKMKRLHNLLQKAEEKKQRLTDLRQTEEGKEKAKEEGWEDAIRVAGGAELKDNPAALKKMIKRKEKDKAKSAAKWGDRLAGQKKEQSKRQEKREENLNRRKKGGAAMAAEADKKAGDAGAGEGGGGKRQRRAGFEGKKQDFINKERPNKAGAQDGGGGRGRGGRGRDGGGRGRGGGGRGGGGRGGRG